MEHGNGGQNTPLHTLVPLVDFKAVLGIDDREDALSRYCLITAVYTIEQYCKRRFCRKKHTDYLTFAGEHIFTLWEYPVRRVLMVHVQKIRHHADFLNRSFCSAKTTAEAVETPPSMAGAVLQGEARFAPENMVDPKHYYCIPDEGIHEDIPFSLVLRPPIRLSREEMGIRVRYLAGYVPGKAPSDLASACLELAAWNMSRYRGRRIGLTGNIRGSGKDGEHLELSMPENVRQLLEPYRRRTI
jgi:hypothetical protein